MSPAYEDRNALNTLLEGDTLTSKAQEKLLWAFVALRSQKQTSITPQQLLEKAEVSASVLKKIVEKGILEVYTEAVDRVSFASDSDTWELTPAQQKALEEVQEQFNQKNTVLLQGVAASGKTLLYSQLIEQTLAQGKSEIGRAHV